MLVCREFPVESTDVIEDIWRSLKKSKPPWYLKRREVLGNWNVLVRVQGCLSTINSIWNICFITSIDNELLQVIVSTDSPCIFWENFSSNDLLINFHRKIIFAVLWNQVSFWKCSLCSSTIPVPSMILCKILCAWKLDIIIILLVQLRSYIVLHNCFCVISLLSVLTRNDQKKK